MKNIFAICKLRLLQLKNNRKQLLMLLVLPSLALFLTQLFVSETIEQVKLPIAFVDEDKSELSKQLSMSLASIDALEVVHKQYGEAKQLLLHHEVDVVIYVESGFEERILKAETDSLVTLLHSPMSLSIGVMKEIVASKLMRFVSNSLAANYVLDLAKEFSRTSLVYEEQLFNEAWDKTNAQWEPTPPLDLVVHGDEVLINRLHHENEAEQGQTELFLLVTLILLLSIYLSTMWLDRKQSAVLKRLHVHRVTNLEQLLAHVILLILLIMLSILPIFIISINGRLFFIILLLTIVSAVSFYSLSTLFVKKYLYASVSALLLLSSILVSGISHVSPQRVVLSMNNGTISLVLALGYFGIWFILSLAVLMIASRRECDKYC